MVLLCGVCGAGKTSYAKQIARERNLRYLNPDDFYSIFLDSPDAHEHEFEVWIALFQAIHMAMKDGVDIVVDTNAPTMVDRVQFLNWFGDFDVELAWVDAPKDQCWDRNTKRRRVIPKDEWDKIYDSFEEPMDDNGKIEDKRYKKVYRIWNENYGYMTKQYIYDSEN